MSTMNRTSLVSVLARLFSLLFYGQIAFALLAFLFPLVMTYQGKATRRVSPLPQASGTVVEDSVRVGGRWINALRDTTGTYHRVSYPPSFTIASVRQIDSLFTTNLNIDYVETRDGYAVARPMYGSSFGIALPLGGRVDAHLLAHGEHEGHPDATHRSTPWYHRLSVDGPIMNVTESLQQQVDVLQVSMSTWQDWLAVPWTIKLTTFLSFIPVVFSALAIYQFKALFESLSRREFFSERQLRRVNNIGYYALLYVLVRLGADLYRILVARQYIVGMGYTDEHLFLTPVWATLTVQWAWLLTGLCILALAQVFNYGIKLQQESELTI